jgi:hypothetical protein
MDLKQYRTKIKNQLLGDLRDQAKKSKLIETGQYRSKSVPIADHAHLARMYASKTTDYDNLVRKMDQYKGPKISMTGYADAGYDSDTQGYTNEFVGGKINIGKVFKGVSKKVVSAGKKGLADVATDALVGVHNFAKAQANKGIDDLTKQTMNVINDNLVGGKFNFVKSMKHIGHDVTNGVAKVGTDVAKGVVKSGVKQLTDVATNAVKSGLATYAPEIATGLEEASPLLLAAGMKKPKRTRKVSQKEMNRHALIRKLMKDHGVTLSEASKHIKAQNLKY